MEPPCVIMWELLQCSCVQALQSWLSGIASSSWETYLRATERHLPYGITSDTGERVVPGLFFAASFSSEQSTVVCMITYTWLI